MITKFKHTPITDDNTNYFALSLTKQFTVNLFST